LGNVRPEMIKRIARELIERYPDKFTTSFEENKKILSSLARFPSIKLRNSIAGYITHLMVISQAQSKGLSSQSLK